MKSDTGLVIIIVFLFAVSFIFLRDFARGRIIAEPISTARASRPPLIFLVQLVTHSFDVFVDSACDTIDTSFRELDAGAGGGKVSGLARGALEAATGNHDGH